MGANSSSRSDTSQLNDDDVNFDHFQILRAIGKGSFGKVCIVQKRDSGVLYAMKYVSRNACESRGALGGVIKEVDLLSTLEHPFLVNLWFSFQDEEDLFMVCDLLTGGDLRYHLQNRVEFSEESVALFVCELGSVLDYLQTNRVVHRDIKPDNILLDDAGHAHLTDFNIATRIAKDSLACSMSGTKPYMAPEVFMTALEEVTGYSYPVDWWSLGVVAYEMRANQRPFAVHSNTTLVEVKNLLTAPVHYPRYWSRDFVDLLQKLLCVHPGGRISTQQELQQTPLLRHVNFKDVLDKKRRPPFKPPEDHLNCDPCLELEEMIVETRPLHKKKKRLAKQRSAQRELDSTAEPPLVKEFIIYNRFKELKRKAMEKKENDWQRELEQAMANSIVNCLAPIQEKPNKETQTTPTTTGDAEAEAPDAPTITRSQLNEMIDGAMAQVRSKCQYPKDVPTSSCSNAEQPGRRLEAANFDDEKPCCSKAALINLKVRDPGSSGQARPNFPDEKPSTSKAAASKSRSNQVPNSSSRKAHSDHDREKQTTNTKALRASPVVETEPIDFIDRTPSPQAPGAQILTSAQVVVRPETASEASAQTPAAPLSRGPSTQPLDRTLRSAAVQTPTSLDAQLHA